MANAKLARYSVRYAVIDNITGEVVEYFGKVAQAKEYAAYQNKRNECEMFEPLADYPEICACGGWKAEHAHLPQEAPQPAAPVLRPCALAEYNNGVTCESGKDPNYPQLWCHICQENRIKTEIAKFPAEFGMRAYPGERFKISFTASYFSDSTLYLYTVVKRGDAWASFCKGTASELRGQIVNLKPALLSKEEAAEIRKQSQGGAR